MIFRLAYLLIYVALGLIIVPIVAYVIFAVSLPGFWKSSVRVSKRKKRVKRSSEAIIGTASNATGDVKLTPEDIEADIDLPKFGIYSGRDGNC